MAQQTQDGSDVIDIVVEVEGHRLTVKVPAELARPAQAGARPRKGRLRRRGSSRTDNASALTAPMQGTIVSVDVEPGAVVETGDTLAVIEAMKMEQPLKASRPATVSKIAVEAGSAVKAGTVLIEFED